MSTFIFINGDGWYWRFASLETLPSPADAKRNTQQRRHLRTSRNIYIFFYSMNN